MNIFRSVGKDFARQSGFSLVELLVAVSVLGIMAAISLVILNPIRENARVNKNQRNAQTLAAVAGAAQAAGCTLNLTSLDTLVNQLTNGVRGTGAFSTSTFRAAPYTSDEIDSVRQYLEITDDSIIYIKN